MKDSLYLVKYGLLAIVLSVLLAYYNPYDADTTLKTRMDKVLNSLLKQEKSVQVSGQVKIAVGYGACKDIFVDAKHVMGSKFPKNQPKNYNEISNFEELNEMFAYFFSHGAAAERFCSKDEVFEELVKQAEQVPDHRVALGGNAPVMAKRFAQEGAEVLLAARMTEDFKSNIDANIQVTGTNIDTDDIHLILEYKRNEVWGNWQAPRANRFIVHSDRNNPTLSSVESFEDPLGKFKPNLLVVGGLQMMDNYPFGPGERQARLEKVKKQMLAQGSNTRVHFEMASFVDETLLQDLTSLVIPYADSLGMNEQELPNLRSMLMFGNISVVSDSNPRTAVTLDQIRDVYRILSGNVEGRPLTRLHLHTLAYQAILVAQGSAWKNNRFAAVKASLTANRHVCASHKVCG